MDFYSYVAELEQLVIDKLMPAYLEQCKQAGVKPEIPEAVKANMGKTSKAKIPALLKRSV